MKVLKILSALVMSLCALSSLSTVLASAVINKDKKGFLVNFVARQRSNVTNLEQARQFLEDDKLKTHYEKSTKFTVTCACAGLTKFEQYEVGGNVSTITPRKEETATFAWDITVKGVDTAPAQRLLRWGFGIAGCGFFYWGGRIVGNMLRTHNWPWLSLVGSGVCVYLACLFMQAIRSKHLKHPSTRKKCTYTDFTGKVLEKLSREGFEKREVSASSEGVDNVTFSTFSNMPGNFSISAEIADEEMAERLKN